MFNIDEFEKIYKQLENAFKKNEHVEVDRLIETHKNSKNVNGETLLFLATRDPHVNEKLAMKLADNGYDAKAASKTGATPLHYAAQNGCVNLMRLLIEKGANISAVEETFRGDPLGWTPLFRAVCDYRIKNNKETRENIKKGILFLLSLKVDINVRDAKGKTPLHLAVLHHHPEIVEFLIDNHANVNAIDNKGNMPLHNLVKNGSLMQDKDKNVLFDEEHSGEIFDLLLKRFARLDIKNLNQLTPRESIDHILNKLQKKREATKDRETKLESLERKLKALNYFQKRFAIISKEDSTFKSSSMQQKEREEYHKRESEQMLRAPINVTPNTACFFSSLPKLTDDQIALNVAITRSNEDQKKVQGKSL